MSLTLTSFSGESIATKVKIAMHQAAFCEFRYALVYNRRGQPVCSVRYRPHDGFYFYRGNRDITKMVRAGVTRYHATH